MSTIMNSFHLNTINNFHHINSCYHQKKNSSINANIINSNLNTIYENQYRYNKLRISLPNRAIKPKIVFAKLGKRTLESTFSPSSKIKRVQPIFSNNNTIYFSKHKNKTTFINGCLNSEIRPTYDKDIQTNKKKASFTNKYLNSETKNYLDKYNNRNRAYNTNSYLYSELKNNKDINYQTINSQNRNQQQYMKKLLNFRNTNSSLHINYNNRKKNLYENSKNNDSSTDKNKNKKQYINGCSPINNLVKKDGEKEKDKEKDKEEDKDKEKEKDKEKDKEKEKEKDKEKDKDKDKDKEKNNTVIKTNKKDFNFMNKNNVSNCMSPQKSLLMNKKTDNQNDTRLSLNKNYKNNLQEKIEIPKVFNPKEFKIIKEIGCGSFGKIYKILWDKNKEKYAMKVMFTKSQENMLYMQDKIHLIMDFEEKTNCDGLIKIYGDAFIKKNDEYYYYEIIELAERDWEQEIIMRKKNLNYYSEWELFIIMSQLVKALSLLQKNHITHRDIKIQNILVINKKYKICDFGEARKLAQKGVIVQPARGSELYMSPIQFFGLNQKVMQVQHNTYKSDVFSLGMCILYAATLSDDCLYDIRELTDMNMIKNILESYLYKRYSIGFIRLLLCLLEINEKKRPDFIQLENIISKIKINE